MGEAISTQLPLLAALVSVAAAIFAARAWPIGVRKRLQAAEDSVVALEAIVASAETRWTAHLAEFQEILESVEGALSAVEKKRKRIAASESRNGGGQEPDEDRRQALMRRAREQGLVN